tara:strand:- start:90 stop:242 length:153 start_codon:yes stop_codon:yes gene_type:complete
VPPAIKEQLEIRDQQVPQDHKVMLVILEPQVAMDQMEIKVIKVKLEQIAQ